MKKKYFPNNWKLIRDTPADVIPQFDAEDIIEIRANEWSIPESVSCIIRVFNTDTNKVKEHVYQRQSYAERKLETLLSQDSVEVTVATPERLYHFSSDITGLL